VEATRWRPYLPHETPEGIAGRRVDGARRASVDCPAFGCAAPILSVSAAAVPMRRDNLGYAFDAALTLRRASRGRRSIC
jgi:hypothetical protein